MLSAKLGLTGGFWGWLNGIDFGRLGYAIVAAFVVTWVVSLVVWKVARIEERFGGAAESG